MSEQIGGDANCPHCGEQIDTSSFGITKCWSCGKDLSNPPSLTPDSAEKPVKTFVSYRICVSCGEHWNETPDTTNKCPNCGGLVSNSHTDVLPERCEPPAPLTGKAIWETGKAVLRAQAEHLRKQDEQP